MRPKLIKKSAAPIELKDIHAVGKRIKFYRERKGLDQKDIAAQIGITPNAVSNWESGRTRPDFSMLPLLCEILNITLYELYGIDAPVDRYSEREQQLVSGYRSLSAGHQRTVDCMIQSLKQAEQIEKRPDLAVLTLCSKQLAAGFDGGAEFDDPGTPIYLHSNDMIQQADLVFPVSGNSMEPKFHDGDYVLVERYPGCPELQFGEIGAFIIGNSAYLKIYEKDGLHSLNKRYKTIKFADDETVFLIGRVLGLLDPNDIAGDEDIRLYQELHAEEE